MFHSRKSKNWTHHIHERTFRLITSAALALSMNYLPKIILLGFSSITYKKMWLKLSMLGLDQHQKTKIVFQIVANS